ncbi:hypothetical protein CAEBREN_04442 [Caenorhabditis brenneri]|uniref:Sdz-33 F-box domain-containing protein n=1 Tax=Caenorhabditis brenneri TaxID=135651 RepID=G0NIJ5_CAEBE|nr:hypothetical protein CAEBREN_04442 [Caenorhabditis brenneri]
MVEYGKYRIYLWHRDDRRDYGNHATCRYGEHVVPVIREQGRTTMETFWPEPLDGMIHVAMLCARVFACQISELYAEMQHERFRNFIRFIMERQTEMARLKITSNRLTQGFLKSIREKLNITEELWLSGPVNIRYRVRDQEPRMIRFDHSPWFTLDQLLSTRCIRIALGNSRLDNEDLDVYIQKWKNGDYPNLVYLEVSGDSLNNQEAIDGHVPPFTGDSGRKSKLIGTYYSATIINGVEVESNNGRSKAVMQIDLAGFQKQFSFLVYQ